MSSIPVGVISGQSGTPPDPTRDRRAQERPRGQPREAGSLARADGQTDVLVDDDNLIGWPPKLSALCTKAYCRSVDSRLLDLGGAGLAQIDDGHAGKVTGGDLLDVIITVSSAELAASIARMRRARISSAAIRPGDRTVPGALHPGRRPRFVRETPTPTAWSPLSGADSVSRLSRASAMARALEQPLIVQHHHRFRLPRFGAPTSQPVRPAGTRSTAIG